MIKKKFHLDKRRKNGKYYAIIDNLVMISIAIISLVISKILDPLSQRTGTRVMTYVSFVLSLLFIIHFSYAIVKTIVSNQNVVIPTKKKYRVGSYYFLVVMSAFLITLLSNNSITREASQHVSFKNMAFYMNMLYLQYLIIIFFSIIRWIFAFDYYQSYYYQSYYYQNKQSYAFHFYKWLIIGMVICGVILLIITIYRWII